MTAADSTAPSKTSSLLAMDRVVVKDIGDGSKPLRRDFPGPRQTDVALRVAMDRRPHAELIAHAKESLEAEVCGVLVGNFCEDSDGVFVHVEAIIRGTAAAEASTHVTFTQATWNSIHQVLERDHPKARIVGWYHTHPGFGVEFSDMDLFIQKNFFSGPAQIALVTDPLTGAVAICINTPAGARYLPRFWVDGREQLGIVPNRADAATPGRTEHEPSWNGTAETVQRLESRINQLVNIIDEQRASYHRFLLSSGLIICIAAIVAVGYFIYTTYTSRLEPPRLNSYAPVPVQIGDKTVLLGIGVVEWNVPDELNALMLEMELLKKEAEEKARAEAAKTNASQTLSAPKTPSKTQTNGSR